MSGGKLDPIISTKRQRIDAARQKTGVSTLRAIAEENGGSRRDFASAITQPNRTNIIAEFKRASPSKGWINEKAIPSETAREYETGGAAAVSVLTEEDHFAGSLDDLRSVREAVQLPLLRKDFIIDEYQIYETAAAGADALLLIASILESGEMAEFQALAQGLGLSSIIEVHDLSELETALNSGASIIGVNNRNLKTFEVSLEASRELISEIPAGITMVAESGLRARADLAELHGLGYSAFLIGESLMRSDDPARMLRSLCGEGGRS